MCKAAGKLVADYLRMNETKALLAEAESDMGIHISLLVESNRSGAYADRGTWIHPDLAVNLATWCSAKFAVSVSRWVYDRLTAG